MPTIDQVLKAVAPSASDAFVKASIACDAGAVMARWGLVSSRAQAQLIGHMAVECQGFRRFDENLNYSAERLTAVWPRRFPNAASAAPFAHNPKALALKVYGGRMGNRPGTDDAWDDRGSGGLQHTGHEEFLRVEKRAGVPVATQPALLRDAASAKLIWDAACSYLADRNALVPAEAGDTRTVCQRINGGLNGLADRQTCVARATVALGGRIIAPTGTASQTPLPQDEKTKTQAANKTVHEDADEKSATVRKVGTGTVAAGGGSGATSHTAGSAYLVTATVVIVVLVVGYVILRAAIKRRNAAVGAAETLQLGQVMQRAGYL